MADIIKNGTDQMIVCPLVNDTWAVVNGVVESLAINLIINNGSDTDLVTAGATLTYSATAGGHKLLIPDECITAIGRYTCIISGSNIQTYILDGLILSDSAISGGGSEIIITGYTHNATAQTLTITDSAYTTIGVERIKEIWNLSKHCKIYDYLNPQANASTGHEIGIQIDGAVIHYDYATTSATNDDKIMIVVFPASA